MGDIETLKKFVSLAEDDVGYHALISDKTSLQGIVLLICNSDNCLSLLALQILLILSRKSSSKCVLRSLIGLQEQLTDIVTHADSLSGDNSADILRLANELLCFLSGTPPSDIKSKEDNFNRSKVAPKCVVLQLYGVESQSDIGLVCEKLLRIRGVISITSQLDKCRMVVYIVPNLDPIELLHVLHHSGDDSHLNESQITAQIVRKRHKSFAENRRSSYCRPRSHTTTKPTELIQLPPYLEDDADLFHVDETKAPPKLLHDNRSTDDTQPNGPIEWLSDLVRRSLFW